MKLAVLRYADRLLVGQVDAEGEATLLNLPGPDQPHEYVPSEDGPELSTGALCRRCNNPRNHQVHMEDVDVVDDDQLEATGPIPVRLYDPIEFYKLVVPVQSPVAGGAGLGIATVPDVLRVSTLVAHLERAQWIGLYTLEGDVVEPLVQDYLALRQQPPQIVNVPGEARGRRRVVEG